MKSKHAKKINTQLTHEPESIHASAPDTRAFFPNAVEKITVEKIEDSAKLESLRTAWNELLSESEANSLFLTWEWLYTWRKCLGERYKLHIVAVSSASRLIAVAPFAVSPAQPKRLLPFRRIAFMGMGKVGTDYLDIVIRRGEEEAALDALSDYLSDHRLMFELKRAKTGSTATSRLAARLEKRGWRVASSVTEICPYIRLEGHSWKSYLSSLGSSHRQNVRRCLRRVDRDFTSELIQVRTDEERRECLRIFESLHHKRWDTRNGSDLKNDDAFMAFHEQFSHLALQNGWLRLFVLQLNGRPAASIYGFRYRDVFYFYQSGFDPEFSRYSVGLVIMALSIRNAIEEGVCKYDLLHGAERYKFLWTGEKQDLLLLQCYPPTIQGTVSWCLNLSRNGIKAIRYRMGRGKSDTMDEMRRLRTDSL